MTSASMWSCANFLFSIAVKPAQDHIDSEVIRHGLHLQLPPVSSALEEVLPIQYETSQEHPIQTTFCDDDAVLSRHRLDVDFGVSMAVVPQIIFQALVQRGMLPNWSEHKTATMVCPCNKNRDPIFRRVAQFPKVKVQGDIHIHVTPSYPH